MPRPLILASASDIRATLLRNAGVPFSVQAARIDEEAIRASPSAQNATPRDLADTLAEHKARHIAEQQPEALVLGCDQIAELNGLILTKPDTPETAVRQLAGLAGQTHRLLSAAVICEAGRPVWRHVGSVRLTMRSLSDAYIEDYVARNWNSIRHAVGAYKLEEEGVRLFSRIDGDYFTVLGLPMIELLSYLMERGDLSI